MLDIFLFMASTQSFHRPSSLSLSASSGGISPTLSDTMVPSGHKAVDLNVMLRLVDRYSMHTTLAVAIVEYLFTQEELSAPDTNVSDENYGILVFT